MEPPLLAHISLLTIDFQFISISIVLIILLALSAMVSGSEISFFSISPLQLDELKAMETKASKKIISLLKRPEKLLATILVANNIINITIVITSTYIMGHILSGSNWSELTKMILEIGVATFLILLFGEVLPKIYATSNNIKFSGMMTAPITWVSKFLYPLIALLLSSSKVTNKLVKKKSKEFDIQEFEHALELTMENANEEEQKILEGIVKFGNIDVKQIMTARTDTLSFPMETAFEDLIKKVVDSGFSRIPIYEDSFDNIKGILYLKDLIPYIGKTSCNWHDILREPMYTPENKMIDDMLTDFQGSKMHLAIVVDEYGGSSGIVTLEDVIEEIVGEITDEFDTKDINFLKVDDNNFVFEGKTPLVDVYRIMDIKGDDFEKSKGEADTIAGFAIELAEKIPLKGEKIKFNEYTLIISASDKRKIKQIKVSRNEDI